MADDFPIEAVATVQQHIEDERGYLSWFNTRIDVIERGRIVMTTPYDKKLTSTVSPPTIHDGIMATLIDTAGGIALRTMLNDPLAGGVVTISLSVNYLRRTLDDLITVAEVVRAGGLVGVSTITAISTGLEEDSDVAVRQSLSSN